MRLLRVATLFYLRLLLIVLDRRTGAGRGVQGWIPSFGNGVLPRPLTLSITNSVSAIRTAVSEPSSKRTRPSRIQSSKEGGGETDSFVDGIAQKTAKEIDDEVFRRFYYAKDFDGLMRLLIGIEADIENRAEEDRNAIDRTRMRGEGFVEIMEMEQAEAKRRASSRVASITVGLDENLKHDIDLQEFGRRVDGLFNWYNDTNQMAVYIAPFFSVIQSSGSGKTRLLMAFREATKANTEVSYDCKTVLCFPEGSESIKDRDVYFDETLFFQERVFSNDDKSLQRQLITNQLQGFLSRSTKDKLVLLFDEAQFLLAGDGNAFRCVCWWLRENRTTKQVVAVFAGTTSKLANFYGDPPASGFSRDPQATFVNWQDGRSDNPTQMYDPFFQICTIGCFHTDAPPDDDLSLSDFERTAFFGRPLFARLQKTKELVNPSYTLHAILKRMLLSEMNWKENKAALCSILGSRVQMGITTSFVFSSDLVSKGYAHLVDFYPGEANDVSRAVARISFMPDPVCAALAMGLMQEKWSMALANGDEPFAGESKKFWSQQALILLASGLCLPEKGDAGEIMAALFMLFCGDGLRHSKDRTMRTFSVLLSDWYSVMRDPNKASQLSSPSSHQFSMDVNFIQVCRNYFRAHSWKTQKALEWMYKSATASYVYPDCEAIDLVATVRVLRNGKPSYHPLLVSVKCMTNMDPGDITKAFDKIKDLLKEVRLEDMKKQDKISRDEEIGSMAFPDKESQDEKIKEMKIRDKEKRDRFIKENAMFDKCPPALSLVVLIGAQREPNVPDTFDSEGLGSFPDEDTFRMISVPAEDPFGISSAAREMTTAYEITEIFSSHWYIYGEDEEEDEDGRIRVLRKSPYRTKADKGKEFVNTLFSNLSN